tara:strand:- start:66 stop:182 length:117 start_codon:yes stop_codon:yes gene_type:complete
MSNLALINIASKLYPNKDLWQLTKEEMSIVVEKYKDFY